MLGPMGFSKPLFLALLLAVPVLFLIERKTLVALPAWRRRAALGLRLAIIVLLILALAGLTLFSATDQLCVLFALDRSLSVPSAETDRALETINMAVSTMTADDVAGLIVFGEDVSVDSAPGRSPAFAHVESVPSPHHTNIAKAIRLALGLFPEDMQKRLVLLTDGNENLGNALSEAMAAAANGVPIDVVTLHPAVPEEVLVSKLIVPEQVDRGKPFDIKIIIESNVDTAAMVHLFKDAGLIGAQPIQLTAGKNVFLLPQAEADPGFHTYRIVAEPVHDTIPDNNTASAFTMVYGEPKVLLVGAEGDVRFVREVLQREEILSEQTLHMPVSPAEIQSYDALFLANVSAETFSKDQLNLIKTYVHDLGGGLTMIGGEDSFGVGGYHDTPVEEALPVYMELRDKKRFPSLGLIMLIDKSGSMSGEMHGATKMELANEAAVAAVELLTPRDQVGVIAFDSAAQWVQPLEPAREKHAIIGTIRSIRAGGGTDIYPALKNAFNALQGAEVQMKHIILLSDGRTAPANFERLVRDIAEGKITLSTVAIGSDADQQLMAYLAEMADGRYYFTDDPYSIPRIFTKETQLVQRSYVVEESFTPSIVQSHEILRGMTGMALPQLHGYIATQAKERGEILLSTHKDDPLLAVWRYGLGKSAAFTSDAKNRWAGEWLEWPGFGKFWEQLARWVVRQRKEGVLHPHLQIEQGKGTLTVDAIDERGKFINFLNLEARIVTPDSETLSLKLKQVAPGRYQAEFSAMAIGPYLVSTWGENVDTATGGHVIPYAPEFSTFTPNHYLIGQIASVSSGRLNPRPEEMFAHLGTTVRKAQPIWHELLLIALLLLPVDIALRRVVVDRSQVQAALHALGCLARLPIPKKQPVPVDTTVEALKERKEHIVHAPKGLTVDLNTVRAQAEGKRTSEKASPKAPLFAEPSVKSKEPSGPGAEDQESYTDRLLQARKKARKNRGLE
jgi:uncharacterized membrane protein/secreted protein with Ig-like and vWFA domain